MTSAGFQRHYMKFSIRHPGDPQLAMETKSLVTSREVD